MEIDYLIEKIKEAKEKSKRRNFTQTFDCIINLKHLDPKNPSHKIDFGVTIKTPIKNKKLKIVGVLERPLPDSDKVLDKILYKNELEEYKNDFSKIKKLYHEYDKFIVHSTIMMKFAQIFGRYLGPLNKMPNPKLGMVINDKTDLKNLVDKINKTVYLSNKKSNVLQFSFGDEKVKDELLAENLKIVLDSLLSTLPNQKNNIKDIYIKLTMGGLVKV